MRFRTWQLSMGAFVSGSVTVVLAGALVIDAMSSALERANPATGRIKGCYTFIDDLLHTTSPLPWARSVELALAFVLVASTFLGVWRLRQLPVSSAPVLER